MNERGYTRAEIGYWEMLRLRDGGWEIVNVKTQETVKRFPTERAAAEWFDEIWDRLAPCPA